MSIVLRLEANASVPAPDSAHSTLYVTETGELVLRNTANATQVFSTSSYGNTCVAAFLPTYTGNLGNVTNIAASGFIYANSGTIAGAILTGNLSTAAQPNITSVGTLTSLNSGAISSSGNVTAANLVTGGLISATGNITGNVFFGNGSQLTGLPAAYANSDVAAYLCSGTVSTNICTSANISGGYILGNGSSLTCLTGASVTGAVAFASTANAVAGANVSGEVSFAATANAVAGGNVSGTVANAAYATCAGTVVTAAQGNITSVGTLTSLSVSGNIDTGNINVGYVVSATGNVTGSYIIGNGSSLTCLAGGNVTGTVANATYATCAGTVVTAAQGNITSVGTLTSLNSGAISSSGNVTGANILTGGIVSATGNVSGNFFIGNGSQLTGLSTSSIANGTSNVSIAAADGNVTISAAGNANIILATGTGANVNGYLYATGNSQLSSLGVGTAASGTSGEIRATNNITAYYSSDRKFKENVQDIPAALDKVAAIGGKTFDWTDEYIAHQGGADGYFIRKSDFGVIAQDVQAVFPQAVRTREDGTLAVDYEKLVALAFAAIVELKAEVAALKG